MILASDKEISFEKTIDQPPSPSMKRSIEHSIRSEIPEIARGHEEDYMRFINGKLIYKPNQDNDVGRLEIPFSILSNPLENTFDLSRCGDTWKYISIATGYRKGQKAKNKDKTEVWIVPKFVVEKNLASTAKHLAPIMNKFTSPVGIFWTWGGWEGGDYITSGKMGWYDYLTVQNFDKLSNGENLYEKYDHSCAAFQWYERYAHEPTRPSSFWGWPPARTEEAASKFCLQF